MTAERSDRALRLSRHVSVAFRVLLAGLVASAVILGLLVIPLPDGVRRPVVVGLLVVLAVVLVSVAILSRRSLAYRLPRFRGLLGVYQGAAFGAAMASFTYLTDQAPPVLCAIAGAAAGVGFGTVMWFVLTAVRRHASSHSTG